MQLRPEMALEYPWARGDVIDPPHYRRPGMMYNSTREPPLAVRRIFLITRGES
jgi:hypothetical protein